MNIHLHLFVNIVLGVFAFLSGLGKAEIPDPPMDVGLIDCLWSSATVGWRYSASMGNGLPVTSFTVEMYAIYDDGLYDRVWRNVKSVAVGDEFSDNDDEEMKNFEAKVNPPMYGRYKFRVMAVNSDGDSYPSRDSWEYCHVPPDRPYRNPSNVRTDTSRPGFLVVKWDPLDYTERNGPDFEYRITIKGPGLESEHSEIYTVQDFTVGEIAIPVDNVNQPYQVKVVSANHYGECPVTPDWVVGYSGEAVPGPVSNLELTSSSSDHLEIRWAPPQHPNGILIGYRVIYSKLGSDNRNSELSTSSTSVVLSGLDPGTNYRVTVKAVSRFGIGEGFNLVARTSSATVPGPVSNLELTSSGSDHLGIRWTQTQHPNGILIGYRVIYSKLGDENDNLEYMSLQLTTDSTSAVLSGLESDTDYRIIVKAMNVFGNGEGVNLEARTSAATA